MTSWSRNLLIAAGLGAGALAAARAIRRNRNWFSFHNKTVLISGGSRGLGLILARKIAEAGARVALCARTSEDLDAAREELLHHGAQVFTMPCDAGDPVQVQSLVEQVHEHFGPIDVLFNVAGIIEMAPLEAMTVDDFYRTMRINCWSALHTTLAVLPDMRRQQWGRIVNIASIGGKQAVPHLLPYVASKFALVGLSNGSRTELMKDGILVTTACPIVMRTGSARNAEFKGQHREEYAWFKTASALPGVSMNADRAADQILDACLAGDGEVMIGHPLRLGIMLQRLFPNVANDLAAMANWLLPEMGGIGQRMARGYESETPYTESWVMALNDTAAEQNNEMRTRLPFPEQALEAS